MPVFAYYWQRVGLSNATRTFTLGTTLTASGLIPALSSGDDLFSSQVSALKTASAEATEIANEDQDSEDEDDDSNSNVDEGSDGIGTTQALNLDGILRDLATDVRCLLDLNPLIEAPLPKTLDKGKAVAQESIDPSWIPHQAYKDLVHRRFPTAHPDLTDRLARINLDRFQRLQQQKWLAVITDEEGTSDLQTVAGQSEFNDSGLGTSLATGSTYAETVMCYGDDRDTMVRVPGLSKTAKDGEPFKCLACCQTMVIKTEKAWK